MRTIEAIVSFETRDNTLQDEGRENTGSDKKNDDLEGEGHRLESWKVGSCGYYPPVKGGGAKRRGVLLGSSELELSAHCIRTDLSLPRVYDF